MKIVCQTVLQGEYHYHYCSLSIDIFITHIELSIELYYILFSEYLNKSVRSVWTKQGATLCAQDEVVEIEFDSHDDYEEVLGYLKSQLRLLLTSFLRRHSSVALMEICGRVEYLILQEGINPENYINRDPTGYIFKDTSFLLRGLESVQPAVDECLKQRQLLIQMHMEDSRRVPAPDPMYAPEDDRRLLSLFDLMMQWNVIDPFLMKWRLRFLLAFCPMLVSDIDRIQQLLSFIFMNLQFNVDTSRLTPLTVPATTPRATIALTKLKDEFLEEAVIVRRRVAAAVPQLFGFCAERIVSSPFYHDLVRQIGSCIADDGGALLGGQKASLRESLVVLSENAQSPGQRDELLSLALEAVVAQWCTLSTQLFINPAVLIDAAKQHCYQSNSSKQNSTTQTLSVDIAPSLMVEASGNPISQVKSILNSVIAIAKRVQCANLEEKLWMEGLQITGDQLSAVFPFTMIWRMMLPGTLAALKVLDDLWNPTIRLSCSAEESVEIYSPPTAFIVSIAMSSLDSDAVAETASLESTTISSVLSDFRRLLYQAIGICCSQRVLYYLPEHTQLIQQLANNISNMENSHVTMLLNQFALKYIFCAPPQVFDVVSGFIENLLSTTQNRVSVAWNKDINSFSPEKPVDMFYQSLYKHCSIPLLGVAVASEVVELAKERIITCMSRAFSDVLASVACIQGPLADKPHTAAGQEPELMATSLLKKKGRKQPVRKPSAFREEDPALEIVIKQNLQVV